MIFLRLTQSKIARYLISGGIAAFVSLGLLYTFTDILGIWYLLSSMLAFIFAFFVSFLLQKLWTFKNTHTHDTSRQFFLYLATALAGLLVNTIFMYILVDIFGVWYMLAQIFSSGIIAAVTFFIYGNVIFYHIQKNRILLATPLYPPDMGGPATYTQLLEAELSKYDIKVTIAPFGSVRFLPKIIRHIVYFLYVCLLSVEAKIIYALDPVSVGFPALLVAKLTRKRFLLRVAGDYAWEMFNQQPTTNNQQLFVTLEEFQEKKFDFATEMRRNIERYVARRADRVIVPSKYLKKIIKQWGVADEKITVIYNAFEPPETHQIKDSARQKLKVHGVTIFSAGRLVPWKGFSTLIDVVAELKKEVPDLKLYIAGDGPQEKDLRFKIKDLRMENTVILLGRLPQDKLAEYVQAADIFVLNTGYEGFSHQLLEVMALGTPIITTNIGGNPELIENQKEGLLVSYNDKEKIKRAVELLITDEALRGYVAQRAREKSKTFSKESAIKSLIMLLDKLEI